MFEILKSLVDGDGLTLKDNKSIRFKTGYQVATEGEETTSIEKAIEIIQKYKGNCGIWFSNGIYYIDKSHRVKTKRDALALGRMCNQISILKWSNLSLVYC